MLLKSAPSSGLFCVGLTRGQGFIHKFFDTYAAALDYALVKDQDGSTVYMGQASFKTDESRKGTNVQAVRSFWLDIDCGPGKPYSDQREGAAALKEFCKDSGLPIPAVVRSGGGLYAYWFMASDVSPSQWKTVADYFKDVIAAYNLDADPARTSDLASVLRPVGSTNRKLEGQDRPVSLVRDAEPIPFLDFVRMVTAAGKKKHVERKKIATTKSLPDNEQFRVIDPTPIDAEKIASRCAQIWSIKTSRGDVDEPMWYAALGLLRYAADKTIPYLWSSGHPDYSEATTEAKIAQHEAAGIGPTTCAHFHKLNPDGCVGCKAKVKSPIQLGRPDPIPVALVPDQIEFLVPTPPGFVRAEDGIWYKDDEVEVKFYDQDLYPIRVAFDEGLGYEVVTFKHHTLHDGVQEFTFRTATVHDTKALMQTLADNHVLVCGRQEKNVMALYIESYIQRAQRARKMLRLMGQMGWKTLNGEPAFVLGKKIYYADGRVDEAALASNVPTVAEAFTSVGEMEPWIKSTEILDRPGMEPFAFALLAGAFGAPVFKFTGFEGAMVSLIGPSGIGKTLITRWAQSAYGDHNKLMMLRDDTRNSLIGRLGLYGSLPLTIDEITNISPEDLSDLVYRVTQGRDKARMTRNAVERSNINHWNTLALVSTNAPLIDKLAGFKADASAEINRIFEYHVSANQFFSRTVATGVYRTISDNYGHVGEKYVSYLVKNTDKHQPNIDRLATMIDKEAGLSSDERYWSALIAATVYGGMVAKKLELIRFDVSRVMTWAVSQIKVSKVQKSEATLEGTDLLGMFLDDHQNHRLCTQEDKLGNHIIHQQPHGALHVRFNMDTGVIYISRAALKKWCTLKNVSYSVMRTELLRREALLNTDSRKNLGAGTVYRGASQPCWIVDTKAPSLGHIGLILKQEIEDMKIGEGR